MKQKILLFHHYGGIGGAGLSLIHILNSIDKSKYDVKVVCPGQPDEMVKELKKINEIDIIETKSTPRIFPHYKGGSYFIFNPKFIYLIIKYFLDSKKIRKIIPANKPDIIITNSMTLFKINKISKQMGIRSIAFHRETYVNGMFGFRKKILMRGLSNADNLVFISKHDYEKSKNIHTKKTIIYDKVDPKLYSFPDNSNVSKKKNILYLGGINKLKGFHILIDSFIRLDDKNITLTILGGKYNPSWNRKRKKYYNKQITKLKKHNMLRQVNFLDNTPNPELFYQQCDLVVFPSTKAHQARPIYEAGFSKKVIIISDFEETSEFAVDNQNVLTFKPRSSIDLTKRIKYALSADLHNIILKNEENSFLNHNLQTLESEIEDVLKNSIKIDE